MNLDELDIEIEDEDGTGVRVGTIRYHSSIAQFTLIDNKEVYWVSRPQSPFSAHEDEITAEILKLV